MYSPTSQPLTQNKQYDYTILCVFLVLFIVVSTMYICLFCWHDKDIKEIFGLIYLRRKFRNVVPVNNIQLHPQVAVPVHVEVILYEVQTARPI